MRKTLLQTISFLLAGLSGLGLAVFFASQWVTPSHSQQGSIPSPPPPVEAPLPPQGAALQQSLVAPQQTPQQGNLGSDPNLALGNIGMEANDVGATLRTLLAPFNYQADNRRDPFRPFSSLAPKMEGTVTGPLLPLQRFELDELQLIGILWDVRKPKAMFSDPEKRVHVLEKDDRIGRNNGYVAVIREGEVVVVETVNIRGELAYSTRVLSIGK